MARRLSYKEAKERAGRFCALRERSSKELFDKVKSWGLAEDDCHTLVDELIDAGFINDQRFANAYCNDKFEFNSWGKLKIKASLFPHQLPGHLIESALERIDEGKYENRLESLAQKKWMKLEKEDELKRKQKTVSYLANKGFELDLIWKVIADLE